MQTVSDLTPDTDQPVSKLAAGDSIRVDIRFDGQRFVVEGRGDSIVRDDIAVDFDEAVTIAVDMMRDVKESIDRLGTSQGFKDAVAASRR